MQGRGVLAGLLAATMASSTFMLVLFGIAALDLQAEFGIERWQVGVLVTASSGAAALVSPLSGVVADRIGARRATVQTQLGAGLSLAAVALAPSYAVLVVAALLTGLPQALANPATNKLIAEQFWPGVRGVVTGVKQSGVQVGVFAAGLVVPPLVVAVGWRAATGVFAVAWMLLSLVSTRVLPHTRSRDDVDGVARQDAVRAPLPPLVRAIVVYGFLLGAAGSTLFTYLPSYAEEVLGLSGEVAGWAVALTGLTGVVARITWGRAAEHRLGPVRSLRVIAVAAVVAPLLLVLADAATIVALLWPAAIVTGLSASAWNAVGMLAIITSLPLRDVGRASGLVMFGFLAGLGLGAPVFGFSVDRLGSYTPGWLAASAVFAAALLTLWRLDASHAHAPPVSPPTTADADDRLPWPG